MCNVCFQNFSATFVVLFVKRCLYPKGCSSWSIFAEDLSPQSARCLPAVFNAAVVKHEQGPQSPKPSHLLHSCCSCQRPPSWSVLVLVLVLPVSTTALCYSSVNCWRPSSPPVIRCGPKVIEATWRRQSRIGDKKWGIIRCLCRPWLDGPSRNISSSKSKAAFTISIQWTQRIKDILSWMWILLCILQVVMIVLRRIWWWYFDQMQAKGAKEAPTVWTLIKKQKRFSPPAMPRLLCLLLILTSKTLVSRVSNFFWPSPSGSDSHSQSASSSPSAPVFLWSFLGITYFLLRQLKRSVPISTRVQVPSALQWTLCLVSNQCIFILCFPLSPASIFENLAEWKALFLHSLDINNST